MFDNAHLDHAHIVDLIAQLPCCLKLVAVHVVQIIAGLAHRPIAG